MTSLVWINGTTTEPARSDDYGSRTPILTEAGWTRPFHVGADHVNVGTVCSIGDGVIVDRSWISWAGWQVLIDLGDIDDIPTWVRLCHLEEQSVLPPGTRVTAGTPVGIEGATGQVAGKHVHWEVYRGRIDRGAGANPGATVDPRQFVLNHLEDDMPLNATTDYEAFKQMLQRALAYDIRPGGAGANSALGPTLWERLNWIAIDAKKTITPEQVTAIAAQVAKAIGQPTVTIDAAAIAKAVNDDAAKRMQG